MCNDYRLLLDIASIAEDFDGLNIKIKMSEGAPNVEARSDIQITDIAPIVRTIDGERGAGELVSRRGGVWGLERGYCMMIGGQKEVVDYLDPIFDALPPGIGTIPQHEIASEVTNALKRAISMPAPLARAIS